MRIALVALLIAVGLSGCGTEVELQGPSGAAARAEQGLREVGSVRLRTTMRGSQDGVAFSAHGDGVIDVRGGRVRTLVTHLDVDEETVVESIAEPRAVYQRYGDGPWSVERSTHRGGALWETLRRGDRGPAEQLALLALVKNVGHVGAYSIDGERATRYAGEVSVPGFQLETVDFWIDDEGLLRRLQTMTISDDGWRMTTTTDFYAYGARIEPIVAPTLG